MHQASYKATPELVMLIGTDQFRSLCVPFGRHIALADQTFRLDLENIREISPQRQLEGEAYPPLAIIVNAVIFVNTFAHGAVENEGQSCRLNLVVLSCDLWVG